MVNINEIQSSQYREKGDGVLLQIPYEFVKTYYPNIDGISFKCNSVKNKNNSEKYGKLKNTLREIDCIYNERKEGYVLKTYSLLFDILYELVTNFGISRPERESIKSKKNLDRLTQITEISG